MAGSASRTLGRGSGARPIARATLGAALFAASCSGGVGGRDSGTGGLVDTESDTDVPTSGLDPSLTTAVPTGGDVTGDDDTTAGDTGPSGTTDATASASGSETGTTTEADPCADEWRVQRAEGRLEAVAHQPGSDVVYAVGATPGAEAWAMAIDACTGRVLADTTLAHPAATDTYATALAIDAGELFVAGTIATVTDAGNGWYAALDPLDLTLLWSTPLYGTDALDDVADIAATASGRLWMSGGTDNGANATAWGISGDTAGSACGFAWNGAGSGSARAVAAEGGDVTLAIRTTAGTAVLATYDPSCTCECVPSSESGAIQIGTSETSIGALLATDGQFHLAGWTSDIDAPSDLRGYAVWLSSSGVPIETYQTDPTTDDDGFLAAATDGEHLYLGGLQGWEGDAGFASATALVEAIALPLDGAPAPVWSVAPTELHDVVGLAVQSGPDGRLYVGGNAGGAGVVVRCDKLGNCGEP